MTEVQQADASNGEEEVFDRQEGMAKDDQLVIPRRKKGTLVDRII